MSYATLVPTPPRESMNTGLSAAKVETLIEIFGPFPGLPENCGECRNHKVASLLETRDVGPFRVTGIKPALDSLEEIVADVKSAHPDLYKDIGTAGMNCYRRVRGSQSRPSNHAAGTALDLTMAGILSPFNATRVPYGLVVLYSYFHKHKWFWAAGYHTHRIDPMHFECSDELLREWHAKGII